MSPDDVVRLRHMIDAIDAALRFAKGRARADLDEDQMLLFALVRAVEVIGVTQALPPLLEQLEAAGLPE